MNWDMKYAEDTRYVDFSSCFFNIPFSQLQPGLASRIPA